mmetsp:Transcript_97844/g.285558  ORF Transcript_97844/g.285558 Transcript_97844/m.285558 type:complete len:216 (-) Transcript_97844:1115-1762(-)
MPAVLVEEVDGHQARLPVVGDEETVLTVGGAAQREDERSLRGGQGEQREAEEVVLVLLVGNCVTVETSRPVEGVVLHEDEVAAPAAAVLLPEVEVLHLILAAVEPDLRVAAVLRVLVVVVPRGNCHGPVAAHGELLGVGAGHHPEATGLGPGVDLAAHHDHGRAEVPGAVPHGPVLASGGLLHPRPQRCRLIRVEELLEGGETGDPPHATETASF